MADPSRRSPNGVDKGTVDKYRAYIRNDVDEIFGSIPLTALTHIDVAQWVQRLQLPNARGKIPSAKTVTNKHGFVAGALNAAVSHNPPIIPANPCTGLGMPKDDDPREMIFLTREQFALLHSKVTEYWQPLTEFLVASGARWGEVVALRPGDVDRGAGTVRIRQSWKQGSGGYRLGTTKTKKGKRTINVPKAVLDKLDYSEEFLFTNRAGGPVRAQGFYNRVWAPALERAWPSVDGNGESVKDKSKVLRPRVHDLRHTCASWMLQARPPVPLSVVSQHLGHEDIRTTVAIYGHLDRTSMEVAADVIGSVLGEIKL